MFGRVVKKDVTVKILGQYLVYVKGMVLKFCEEQVPDADLQKDTVRLMRH
jgi:hypothetical protein